MVLLKRILKIVLLVCCILLTSLSAILMYTVLITEKSPFEYSMLFPLTMVISGVLSIIYHFKTFKYYSLKGTITDLKDGLLWVGNMLFALSIFSMIIFILYSINKLTEAKLRPEIVSVLVICVFVFILGISLIFEEVLLYKKIINYKKSKYTDSINDIKGIDINENYN
jgi:hypothetical protein